MGRGGWKVIRKLGSGGQGDVFLARSPAKSEEREALLREIETSFVSLNAAGHDPGHQRRVAENLADSIVKYSVVDDPVGLGAFKQFKIPASGDETTKAVRRLGAEVECLSELAEPGLLKLLDASVDEHWVVTEYHPGVLTKVASRYRGNVAVALAAFRPLVAAVAVLHGRGIVHRDIKPENIFVSRTGDLILAISGSSSLVALPGFSWVI